METLLPHNLEAEKSIIGEVLSNGKESPYVITNIKPEFFYSNEFAIIFRAITDVNNNGQKPDVISVGQKLDQQRRLKDIGGYSRLTEISNFGIASFSIRNHADMVRSCYIRRKTWEVLTDSAYQIREGKEKEKTENIISEMLSEVVKIVGINAEEKTSIKEIVHEFNELQEKYAQLNKNGQSLLGISCGYKAIDRAIDGYRPEHLWTLAAYTSVGKTSMLINLVHNLLKNNKRVVIFSLEMSKVDMLAKLVAIEAKISPKEKKKNIVDDEISEKSTEALGNLYTKNLTIYSEVDDIDRMITLMQFETAKQPVDVFFIDYLQNISSSKNLEEYHLITNAVKKLQVTTRRLKTTTVLISQVSNETKRAVGTLDVDGKGSGAIKAASNFFMYLKRDGNEEEIAKCFETGDDIPLKCIINKNRHGKIGSFNLKIRQDIGEIYEI